MSVQTEPGDLLNAIDEMGAVGLGHIGQIADEVDRVGGERPPCEIQRLPGPSETCSRCQLTSSHPLAWLCSICLAGTHMSANRSRMVIGPTSRSAGHGRPPTQTRRSGCAAGHQDRYAHGVKRDKNISGRR